MARPTSNFFIPAGSQLPNLVFTFEGAQESDFSSINLNYRRSDGKLFGKTAVIDDPGNVSENIPLVFHFEWDPGDIIEGNHEADLILFVDGEPLILPDMRTLKIISRASV